MVKQGWAHGDLMGMTADEFAYWFHRTMEFAEAESKAVRDAADKAKQSNSRRRPRRRR